MTLIALATDAEGRPLKVGDGVRCPGATAKGVKAPDLADAQGRVVNVRDTGGTYDVQVDWTAPTPRKEWHRPDELVNTD